MTAIFRRVPRSLATLFSFAALLDCTWTLAAERNPQPFQKGDTVCFIGDSITHNGKYQAFVYLFYVTRFPDREIKMYNCGISGDSAGGACRRFEWDILPHRPTAATVLLGMNDVGRTRYGRDKTDAKSKQARQNAIQAYARNMTQLAEKLQQAKVRTTFLTPTIYEQNADTGTENLYGCNDGLEDCGREAARIAKQYGFSAVDMHAAMNAINEREQRRDPKFTLVGRDRVHPGEVGHLVMAYILLTAQRVPKYVAKMDVAASGTIREAVNCRISNVQASRASVAFDCLAGALPYPVSRKGADALRLVPFTEELNQEILKVDGLAPGTYELRIDGQPVGDYDAGALAAGVNLATNAKTPQYQQAEQVAALNTNRHTLESGRLRTFAAVRHGTFSHSNVDPGDFAAVKELFTQRLEKMKNSPYYDYNKFMYANYLKYKPRERETIAEVEQAMPAMYQAARPKSHRFAIVKKG
jgi:lysophospholipase L1-like esterase